MSGQRVDTGYPSYLLSVPAVSKLRGQEIHKAIVRALDNQIFADLWPWLVLST